MLLFAAALSNAQDYTWAEHIAPIVYKKCASCHRNDGIAPFSMTSYEDAKNVAIAIKSAIESKHMPPWPPDPSYNRLAHERILTDEEKTAIFEWIAMGTASGNLSQVPPLPDFPENGDLPGTPDLVLQIPTYTIQATTEDEYRCFSIKNTLTQDAFITAWEVVPGNRSAVHHVLVYQDETGQCASLDAANSEPGYQCFGSACDGAEPFGAWAPGGNPLTYPPGMGIRLKAGVDVIIEMHYPKGNAGEVDSTELHFFLSPAAGMREVFFDAVADPWETNLNPPFTIPANQVKTFNTRLNFNFGADFTLLRVMPHMHLLGKSMEAWLDTPTPGVDTLKIIKIPKWDFHWQGMYALPKLVRIKNGTKLNTRFTYDNTTANPNNPNFPPQTVFYGEATTDEMLFLFVEYLDYQPGDENIIFDSTALISPAVEVPGEAHSSAMLLPCQPNPVRDFMSIPFYLPGTEEVSLEIFDLHGKLVATPLAKTSLPGGNHSVDFRGKLSPGLYFVQMACGSGARKTSKFAAL